MKRFWKDVAVSPVDGGWQVLLDGRAVRTQGGAAQILPTQALADALAEEWRAQGDTVDPHAFPLRDMADYAIDHIRHDPAALIETLLRYAETDTLCYRAAPDEPLFERQQQLWEPVLTAFETRHGIRLTRVSGITHHPHPAGTLDTLRGVLDTRDAFSLSALNVLTSLAASLTVGLEAAEEQADATALFAVANAEEDWQAELWGWDSMAEQTRALRLAAFETAARFLRLARN